MIESVIAAAENNMKRAIEALRVELTKLRTGRAHSGLLDHVKVMQYGSEVPLAHLASINITEARTFVITPWDETILPLIEKAITLAGLGLNPTRSGKTIRIILPALTEERRREFIKLLKQEAENARIAVRNNRRDANNQLKDLFKKKSITEDIERRAQDNIQKMTDKYILEIEKIITTKEKELMEI